MKITSCQLIESRMDANPVIVCYRTDGGQIALLRKRAPTRWGFAYLYGTLRPYDQAKVVFAAPTAYDAMQSAQDAGRILYEFEEVTAFLNWVSDKQMESVPFEKGSYYYLTCDVEYAGRGTRVVIVNPGVDFRAINAKVRIPNGSCIVVNKAYLSKDQWQAVDIPELAAVALAHNTEYPVTKGDTIMKFEMIPVLNGRNLSDVSTDELIDVIAKTEKEIVRLESINIVSTVVKARVEKLQDNLVELVIYIDKERGSK